MDPYIDFIIFRVIAQIDPEFINNLKDTPLPTILALSGIFFLLLAVADQVGATIVTSPTQKKLSAIFGIVLLILAVALFLIDTNKVATDSPNEPTEGNSNVPYVWESFSKGNRIPKDRAVYIDTENGQERYLCRGRFSGNLMAGKTVQGNCNIPYYSRLRLDTSPISTENEKELSLSNYEVLLVNESRPRWVSTVPGKIPENAQRVSNTVKDSPHICRARYEGAEHPGNIDGDLCIFSWGGAVGYVPYDDPESPKTYDVLIID